ncbi:MAG: VanZ family protein [Cryomorphaceae bacterium]|nr:VanZ family protein [Cryomorphaceae bacterium]
MKISDFGLLQIYIAIIFILHCIPLGNDLNLSVQNSYVIERLRLDHLLHGLMFIPIFGLFFRAISIESLIKRFFFALFLSLGVATVAELLQIFLPYRAFTFPDLQANLVGVFLGMILFGILRIIQHSFQNIQKA